MKEHEQWHKLEEDNDNGDKYLTKYYVPSSYEIKNELSWLTSNLFGACMKFQTPTVVEASISKGYIKMVKVESESKLEPEEILTEIISLASELHSVIKSPEPRLRNHANASEFIPYLKEFAKNKLRLIGSEIEIDPRIIELMLINLESIKTPYFSIVHRDLRYRHVLQISDQKPVLIDWEFSNISHFDHDLAKLICDYVVNHGFDANYIMKTVIETYRDLTKIPEDLIFKAVRAFIPLVLLEHGASFVQRKCTDYMTAAKKDIEQLRVFTFL